MADADGEIVIKTTFGSRLQVYGDYTLAMDKSIYGCPTMCRGKSFSITDNVNPQRYGAEKMLL